jgi:RNA polymerase sigma-70 factor (ECF subfamily)
VVSAEPELQPEEEAMLADSVGLALQVVLDTLSPAERVAFVLHDMFQLPFEEIAALLGRTPVATRQLASRARRRVGGASAPDRDLARQRAMVDAFFAATREGDFDALVAMLDPAVTLRIDGGARQPAATMTVRGAEAVARQALSGLAGALRVAVLHAALVNGAAGTIVTVRGRPFTVIGFAIVDGRIAEIDAIADPDRLPALTAGLG